MFVNMVTFDEANEGHRKVVDGLLHKLLEDGKKRGFVCYRTHVNYMGKSAPHMFEMIRCKTSNSNFMPQISSLIYLTSMATLIEDCGKVERKIIPWMMCYH